MEKITIILIIIVIVCISFSTIGSGIGGYFYTQRKSAEKPELDTEKTDKKKIDKEEETDKEKTDKEEETDKEKTDKEGSDKEGSDKEGYNKSPLGSQFSLKHKSDDKCIDGNGSSFYFHDCLGNDEQKYAFNKSKGKGYNLQHVYSSKCIDINGNGDIVYENCDLDNPSQGWIPITDGNLLKNSKTEKCLDGNGTTFSMSNCDSKSTTQGWTPTTQTMTPLKTQGPIVNTPVAPVAPAVIEPPKDKGLNNTPFGSHFTLKHGSDNKCLDGNGSTFYYNDCLNNAEQNFAFIKSEGHGYNMKHGFSNKCIDVNSEGNIIYNNCDYNNPSQAWSAIQDGNLLKNTKTGQCLDGDGSKFYFGDCKNGNPYQNWFPILSTDAVVTTKEATAPILIKQKKIWNNCALWDQTWDGTHDNWCVNDFGPGWHHIGRINSSEEAGCPNGRSKGICANY